MEDWIFRPAHGRLLKALLELTKRGLRVAPRSSDKKALCRAAVFGEPTPGLRVAQGKGS